MEKQDNTSWLNLRSVFIFIKWFFDLQHNRMHAASSICNLSANQWIWYGTYFHWLDVMSIKSNICWLWENYSFGCKNHCVSCTFWFEKLRRMVDLKNTKNSNRCPHSRHRWLNFDFRTAFPTNENRQYIV